ncbi:MAG: EAL domain-containing protein, partial [Nitrososphaera sp.]|nr:EAL domain-containing protein [Nitrososphaera sp.]
DSALDDLDPNNILKQPAMQFGYDTDLDIGERKWRLLFNPGPGYIVKRRTWQPWLVLLGGMILTGIVSMYMAERSRVQKERRQSEEAVEFLAYHDPLTKLPNRSFIQKHLPEVILKAHRENHPAALLLMDLEHFKEINDTLGHHRGDEVLQQVGLRLQSVLWEPDVVSRLGGDEFAVLLPNLAASEHIWVVVKKILNVLESPFLIEGLPIHVEASIGIAVYPDQGTDWESLMQRADIAMYAAKKAGSGYAIYTSEQDEYSPKRLALMGELRQAIEQDQLFLHYQPKVSLKTGHLVGVEVLVRWQHPEHGFIPPIEFIGPAERTGLIKPLTECILEKALRQCHFWRKAGLELSMSVNLSARYLGNPVLAARIMEGLHRFNLEPRFLELEITESAIMADPSRAIDLLGELTKLGVRISIDDFGTGYSSLGYLQKLPVYAIKIDKSFVMNIHERKIDASIVECTIRYGHNLGLEVVAEGVENKQAWDQLVNLGCDLAQGYYMCRPLPAAELTKWMSEPPWGITAASPGI